MFCDLLVLLIIQIPINRQFFACYTPYLIKQYIAFVGYRLKHEYHSVKYFCVFNLAGYIGILFVI